MPEVIEENSIEEVKSVSDETDRVNYQLDYNFEENDKTVNSDDKDQNRLGIVPSGQIVAADDQVINIEVLRS